MILRHFLSCVTILMATMVKANDTYVVLQYNTGLMSSSDLENNAQNTHEIISGETIYGIVMHSFGASSEINQLIEQTVQNNPEAFLNGDANKMSAGHVLRLPTQGTTSLGIANAISQF
ncbi:MAG: hypothetical protein P8P65_17530 [Planktotalea sp.]|jgi:Tfp pilus assembly protein FimV|uniref:type IV pilus assembly protein FimV n=1 Tax=Planktotalea sp. TaxID=2029877 RepID=UPI0002E38BE7|nr:hypothetical protein [Planktotalea sp.]MDG1078424.1 hypothetical protein [Planktotalea sp.]MDG1085145.1 hypothetical protein [Planktotalea sp.]HCW84132.1 hypothetical protein [Paracoccaceae bacterium]